MKLALLLVLALLAGACGGNDPDGAEATTTETTPPTTMPAPSTTSTAVATTTTTPTTTTTTAPVEVDVLDPVAGTLAGVQVGQGPVEPIIEALTAAYGPPDEDRGWAPDVCIGGTTRHVLWSGLAVYLEESEAGQGLMGYTLDQAGASMVAEPIELPDGIELGMSHSDAAALFPDGAYTHDSLELDGVILQETPTLIVIGQHTDDGSGPLTEVWVGAIPTCH